jgi:hypothetical protein
MCVEAIGPWRISGHVTVFYQRAYRSSDYGTNGNSTVGMFRVL